MKTVMKLPALLLLMLVMACGEDTESNPRAEMIDMLTASTWITESVMHSTDGDLTFQYEEFSITFMKNEASGFDGDYLVLNGGNAFPEPVGKWKFNDDLTQLIFSDGQELDIELTENSCIVDFFVAADGGRVTGLSGQFTFVLKH